MKFADIVLLFVGLMILIKWGYGIKPDMIEQLQSAIELLLMVSILIGVLPRLIKKLRNGDFKKFLGVMPTIGVLAVIGWKFPDADPAILEVLAIALIVLNLLTLNMVKRKLAKRWSKDSSSTPTDQINKESDKVSV